MDKIEYYKKHSKLSKISNMSLLELNELPKCPDKLFLLVQNLVVHEMECKLGNYAFAKNRFAEINIRDTNTMLERIIELNSSSLFTNRPVSERLICSCRGASLLYVSLLRQVGISARLRVGFINYNPVANFNVDHVIVEFYDEVTSLWRWADILVTSEFRLHNIKAVNIIGNDIKNGEFISVEDAWVIFRQHSNLGESFGVGLFKSRRGGFTIRNKLLHELAARLKIEMLPGDLWGYMLFEGPSINPSDLVQLDLLDSLASALLVDDLGWLRQIYCSNAAVRVPSIVLSHSSTIGGIYADEIGEIKCD